MPRIYSGLQVISQKCKLENVRNTHVVNMTVAFGSLLVLAEVFSVYFRCLCSLGLTLIAERISSIFFIVCLYCISTCMV